MRALGTPVLAAVLCAGCATDDYQVNEFLDPQTGVTIRAMASPFVYVRDVNETADNGREYVSVGAVEVNTMGARKHYLAVVSWSRINQKPSGAAVTGAEHVMLMLGGKPRELIPVTQEPRSVGIREPPFRPEWGNLMGENWYVITPQELRAFAAATPDSIDLIENGRARKYVTMDRADASLRDFVRDFPATVTNEPLPR